MAEEFTYRNLRELQDNCDEILRRVRNASKRKEQKRKKTKGGETSAPVYAKGDAIGREATFRLSPKQPSRGTPKTLVIFLLLQKKSSIRKMFLVNIFDWSYLNAAHSISSLLYLTLPICSIIFQRKLLHKLNSFHFQKYYNLKIAFLHVYFVPITRVRNPWFALFELTNYNTNSSITLRLLVLWLVNSNGANQRFRTLPITAILKLSINKNTY